MLDRLGPILKFASLGLAILVFFQFTRLLARKNPLEQFNPPMIAAHPSTLTTQPEMKETNSVPRPGARDQGPPLPPAIQARIDRITQSEILAPVIRPLPMALLGIAGKDAFLRAANGQTGLIREGEELGGIKLLRIGTNRVLIEHEGQKKELMLFGGFGSESLLPKEKEDPK